MTGWEVFGFVWLWAWGFALSVTAVQQQKGNRSLAFWDFVVSACWPLAVPGVIIWLLFERKGS